MRAASTDQSGWYVDEYAPSQGGGGGGEGRVTRRRRGAHGKGVGGQDAAVNEEMGVGGTHRSLPQAGQARGSSRPGRYPALPSWTRRSGAGGGGGEQARDAGHLTYARRNSDSRGRRSPCSGREATSSDCRAEGGGRAVRRGRTESRFEPTPTPHHRRLPQGPRPLRGPRQLAQLGSSRRRNRCCRTHTPSRGGREAIHARDGATLKLTHRLVICEREGEEGA